MRLIKAEVVAHADSKGNRFGIYSMDIQPNSNRLATGGGGRIQYIHVYPDVLTNIPNYFVSKIPA